MRIRTAASPSPVAGPPHPAATEAMRAPSLPLHPLHSLFSLISVRPTTWSHSLSCSRGPIGRHARGPHTRDGPRIQSAGGMLRALPWTRIGQLTPRMLFSNQRERMGRIACGFSYFPFYFGDFKPVNLLAPFSFDFETLLLLDRTCFQLSTDDKLKNNVLYNIRIIYILNCNREICFPRRNIRKRCRRNV